MTDYKSAIIFLSCGAGVLLLIACINAANLFLARSVARSREWSIRAAIGASRGRLIRQMTTEGLVVAFLSGGLAIGIAALALHAIRNALSQAVQFHVTNDVGLNVPVLIFTAAVCAASAIVFSIVPALRTIRPSASLTVSAKSGAAEHGSVLKRGLVMTEVALATLLAGGTLLLLRSFLQVTSTNPGFQAEHVVTANLPLPGSRYKDADQVRRFADELQRGMRGLPGVIDAGFTSHLPISGQEGRMGFVIDGIAPTAGVPRRAHFRVASPGYFETMRIVLRKGRFFSDRDAPDAPLAMIINETAARRHFGDRDPVGMRARFVDSQDWRVIVGVIADVRHWGLEMEPQPEAYLCTLQTPSWTLNLVARSAGETEPLFAEIRKQVRAIDPAQVVVEIRTLGTVIDSSLSYRRLYTSVVAFFSFAALLLAAIGIYGVIAYLVSSRTAELGIRMALGATPMKIMRLVVGDILVVAVVGATCGSAALYAAKPLLTGLLHGITERDPASLVAANLLLIVIASLAAWGPAARASRLDPANALRVE